MYSSSIFNLINHVIPDIQELPPEIKESLSRVHIVIPGPDLPAGISVSVH